MKLPTFLLISLTTLNLVACTAQQNTVSQATSTPSSSLEILNNIDAFPESSLGNQAILSKQPDGSCNIQFTGFYHTGKVIELWQFQGDQVLNASTTKVKYPPSSDFNPQSLDTKMQLSDIQSSAFDIKNPEKIQNFMNLKKQFQEKFMEQCHK